MNEFFKTIIGVLGLVAMTMAFFCPIAISYSTGNWWYMFLFFATWIPSVAIAIITKEMIE